MEPPPVLDSNATDEEIAESAAARRLNARYPICVSDAWAETAKDTEAEVVMETAKIVVVVLAVVRRPCDHRETLNYVTLLMNKTVHVHMP